MNAPATTPLPPLGYRRVFLLTWPMILSNIATPLLGLVDTAVIGNLGNPALLGGIALGGVVFNFIYWGFGFLRMGTTGMTAQAHGAGDGPEIRATLARGLLLAAAIGLALILLQMPLGWIAFRLLSGSDEVQSLAALYFHIRICGAPFALAFLVLMGWLIGLQQMRTALYLQVLLNGLNIALDLLFVLGFGWGVAGVAIGTVLSNVAATVVGLYIARRILAERTGLYAIFRGGREVLLQRTRLAHTFRVNRDIMIRTILLVFSFTWFINESARMGDVALAANAILMQFLSFAAFFLDGIAFTAETLVGEAAGRRSKTYLDRAVWMTTVSALVVALVLTGLYAAGGGVGIDFLTDVDDVRAVARSVLPWAVLTPVVGMWCWQLDGIFIGATRTVAMRNAAIYSLIVFLLAWWILQPRYGLHGLWAAFHIYFIARAVTLGIYYPALRNSVGEGRV